MRKQITSPNDPHHLSGDWLDLEKMASVELSSEQAEHPIEAALSLEAKPGGWRASTPGVQTIRILFDRPQSIQRISLLFIEEERPRNQEFVLSYSQGDPRDKQTFREIVRQQWNFNPLSASVEAEDYQVGISGITALLLTITPERSGGDSLASLAELRIR